MGAGLAHDPVALTQALIRRASVTPRDDGAIGTLAETLRGLGFDCTELPFSEPGTEDVLNLWARLGSGGPHLCFAGHTDVVPPGDPAHWKADPFAAEVIGGQLYGRGAVDMKGAIAAFVAAVARFLDRRGREFGGSISLLVTGDEEGVSINGTRKVVDWLEARGERIDACIVGEPTNPENIGEMVKVGRRGSLTGKLTVHGVQGHTAYPHLADNPVHRLVRMLDALIAKPLDEGTSHFQASTLQVATFDVGNPASNVIPATARATFNIRYNDRWTSETLRAWLGERLDAIGGRYELDIHVSGESFLTPPGPLSDLLGAAIERVTNRRPELSTTGGTSDARFIRRLCPTAEFGLISQTMHKVDERVDIADTATLSRVYEAVLDLYLTA